MHEELFPILKAVDAMLEPVMNDVGIQCHSCPYDDVCCTSFVSVTALEADAIVAYLLEHDVWNTYFLKLKRQERRAPRSYLAFIEDRNNHCLQWFARKVYCAFYDHKAKRCGIYDVRPLMCRGLFAALGTKCREGESQSVASMARYIDHALFLSFNIARTKEELAGELSSMIIQSKRRNV